METRRASKGVGCSTRRCGDDRWGDWVVTITIFMMTAAKEGKHGGSAMVNPLEEA